MDKELEEKLQKAFEAGVNWEKEGYFEFKNTRQSYKIKKPDFKAYLRSLIMEPPKKKTFNPTIRIKLGMKVTPNTSARYSDEWGYAVHRDQPYLWVVKLPFPGKSPQYGLSSIEGGQNMDMFDRDEFELYSGIE